MATPADLQSTVTADAQLLQGPYKFLRDTATVLEMKLNYMRRTWQWYLVGGLVFPMGMFFWSRAMAPVSLPDRQPGSRRSPIQATPAAASGLWSMRGESETD